jgi:hypothetical protein
MKRILTLFMAVLLGGIATGGLNHPLQAQGAS